MYEIPEELLKATLNYLINQPYANVFRLIQALQQCKPKEEPKIEAPKEEE